MGAVLSQIEKLAPAPLSSCFRSSARMLGAKSRMNSTV
jgi:hypothetical protein